MLRGPRRRAGLLLDVALPLLLGAGGVRWRRASGSGGPRPGSCSSRWPRASCSSVRPLRFALGLAIVAVVIADFQDASRKVVLRERSFFGVLRVSANFPTGMNTLAHGSTIHGMQRRSPVPSVRRIPLMYYFPTGPIGQVFEAYQGTPVVQRVGVVGLGVGSLAGYGKTGQEFTFFEIDPAVERIARNPAYFHYLEDCRARWRVVLGDARLSLSREPDGSFGLIVLDAFNGDAIPVHLLTREALRIYLAKLADGGLIALHISNNYLDLEPAVPELARDAGLVGLDENEATIPSNEFNQGRINSHWVVLRGGRPTSPGWRAGPAGDPWPGVAARRCGRTTAPTSSGSCGGDEPILESRQPAARAAQRAPPCISKELASMTSPLALVPRAIQVNMLIESLMNLTLPSAIVTLTPPGW